MKLRPVETPSEHYDFADTGTWYALVGRASGYVYMVFDAHNVQEAERVRLLYSDQRKDSGYDLMRVEGSVCAF